jgi:hypothetical protein
MRVIVAAAVLTMFLFAASAYAEQPWFVGERGTVSGDAKSFTLHACNSYDDWVRFEALRYRENDTEAAIKFLDQQCPTTITGRVVVEQVAKAPSDIPVSAALCLRPEGNPSRCIWLDSSWVRRN